MALGSCTWAPVVCAQVAQVPAAAQCQLPDFQPTIGGVGALLPRVAGGEAVAALGSLPW